MRSATARAAMRRGSSMRMRASPRQAASSSASGTTVLLPAPGGASSTTWRPAASASAELRQRRDDRQCREGGWHALQAARVYRAAGDGRPGDGHLAARGWSRGDACRSKSCGGAGAACWCASALAGSVLPALPGVPLVFAGLLLAAWAGGFRAGWLGHAGGARPADAAVVRNRPRGHGAGREARGCHEARRRSARRSARSPASSSACRG